MWRFDYKWVMLALVSSVYFLAQGTRQIYNSVLPIAEEFEMRSLEVKLAEF